MISSTALFVQGTDVGTGANKCALIDENLRSL